MELFESTYTTVISYLFSVLGIRDILVRIRIRGSVPDPTPAPDPAIFVSDQMATKKKKFLTYLAYYFLNLHLHPFSKSQTVGIKVSLTIFA